VTSCRRNLAHLAKRKLGEDPGAQCRLRQGGQSSVPPAASLFVDAPDAGTNTYPKMVRRDGPESGIGVAHIPAGHALLLTVHTRRDPDRDPETVTPLHLIEGGPPSRVSRISAARRRHPPGLRPAKPPSAI
jgi:hypothetical protein